MRIFLMIVLAIASLAIIVSVLFQSSESKGLSSAITGGASQLFGNKKKNALDDIFKKVTIIAGIVFAVCSVVLTLLG